MTPSQALIIVGDATKAVDTLYFNDNGHDVGPWIRLLLDHYSKREQ
jgi:hypothetical protein